MKRNFTIDQFEAIQLRGRTYVVRPIGQLGTCGFYPFPWDAIYIKANSEKSAIRSAVTRLNEHGFQYA